MHRDPTYAYNMPEYVDELLCPICRYELVPHEGDTCASCDAENLAWRHVGHDASEMALLAQEAED